jgi:tRNA nucleotidyltransferase (CCA-adding enzyme)
VSRVPVEAHQIPREVVELCRALGDKGYKAWVVGGCLRDLLLGRVAADWDLATSARPDEVARVFPKVLPTGIAHGTVTVRHRGQSFELTTLRGEGAYSDGRRPDAVVFVSDIAEDLSRRDFTVNAMAYDPLEAALIDPFGGQEDLGRRLIRAVGEPERRFSEDGLRVLRAARFCASLEFELEAATEASIPGTLETFRKVSAERVRDEWMKALRARQPSRAFAVMLRSGILAVTFARLAQLPAAVQTRSFTALDAAPREDPLLRLAALLWPLHAERELIARWLTDYRFSNQERERVLRLVRYVEPSAVARPDDAALRQMASAIERPHLADVGRLGRLLAEAHHSADSSEAAEARDREARLGALSLALDVPLSQRELALGGKELMAALSLAPGPQLGTLLTALLQKVLEDPALNQRERLVELARSMV